MSATQWFGACTLALLFAFAAFAFRQGTKVKPSDDNPLGGIGGGSGDSGGFGHGGGADGGGGH
jgi:hypothetical protein